MNMTTFFRQHAPASITSTAPWFDAPARMGRWWWSRWRSYTSRFGNLRLRMQTLSRFVVATLWPSSSHLADSVMWCWFLQIGPRAFKNLRIRKLNLDKNRIKSIHKDALRGLENVLQELSLSQNKLTEVRRWWSVKPLHWLGDYSLSWSSTVCAPEKYHLLKKRFFDRDRMKNARTNSRTEKPRSSRRAKREFRLLKRCH